MVAHFFFLLLYVSTNRYSGVMTSTGPFPTLAACHLAEQQARYHYQHTSNQQLIVHYDNDIDTECVGS
jgi:hypothetical protein